MAAWNDLWTKHASSVQKIGHSNLIDSPILATLSWPLRVVTYLLLLLAASGAVGYDWNMLGPTVALKNGALAVGVAWLLIVPFWMVSAFFMQVFVFLGLCGLATGAAGAAYMKIGGTPGFAVGVLILTSLVWLACHTSIIFGTLEPVFGTVLVFLAVYGGVRTLMTLTLIANVIAPISSWQGVMAVDKNSQEYTQRNEEFDLCCASLAHKYDFWLHVVNIYRVENDVIGRRNGRLARTTDGRRLFHGTKRDNAHGILSDGFRLPDRKGMFGKGIYFADTPLKSWQYTDGMYSWTTGLILACWVELGRPCHQKSARTDLTRPPRRSFLEWVKGKEKYSSVVGDDHEVGGSLRAPEYIIYDPSQAEVEYIFEVKRVPPGTPAD